jgi:NAD-dependent dihydropyrimidine dehydrogenase PreA subunit
MIRKIIEIDESLCNGCGACVTGCAEGALEIRDGKAKVVADHFCDGLGACIGHCPTGALAIIEREAPDFDEKAVEAHLAAKVHTPPAGCCPSTRPMPLTPCQAANIPSGRPATDGSSLGTWPIKLRLVPPDAPFLTGARLLLTSDCVPPAFPAYQTDFLPGKVALLGCPKFDDVPASVEKLTAILRANDITDITVVQMEVPCCAGMARLAARAVAASGKNVPVTRVVVSRRGKIVDMGPVTDGPLAMAG